MSRKKEFLRKLADLMQEYKVTMHYTNKDDGISINIDWVSPNNLGMEALKPTFLNDGYDALHLVRTEAENAE